jgi:hypothetical protein
VIRDRVGEGYGREPAEKRERSTATTRLHQAADNAQLAAGLPARELARTLLIEHGGRVPHQHCAR